MPNLYFNNIIHLLPAPVRGIQNAIRRDIPAENRPLARNIGDAEQGQMQSPAQRPRLEEIIGAEARPFMLEENRSPVPDQLADGNMHQHFPLVEEIIEQPAGNIWNNNRLLDAPLNQEQPIDDDDMIFPMDDIDDINIERAELGLVQPREFNELNQEAQFAELNQEAEFGAINLNVHTRALTDTHSGYPGLYDTIAAQLTTIVDAQQASQDILNTLSSQQEAGTRFPAECNTIRQAVHYMLLSAASQHPVMDYPSHITLRNVLSDTWSFILQATEFESDKRTHAIDSLFQGLADAGTGLEGWPSCSTGHASRTLQALTIAFPDQFKEPIQFTQSRDTMQKLSKSLVRDIARASEIQPLHGQEELNEEQLGHIKAEFNNTFEQQVQENHPNIPPNHISQFVTKFIEPVFELLADQALRIDR